MESLSLAVLLLISLIALSGGLLLVMACRRAPGNYLAVGHCRLFYTFEGRGEAVLLLHGLAAHGDLNWRLPGLIRSLRKHYSVICLDLRGHGLSGKPVMEGQYGLQMVADVPRLLDHLGITRVHLVGYSLGGFIALKVAAMHPDRLIDLTLIAAGWERPDSRVFHHLDQCATALRAGRSIPPPGAVEVSPSFMETLASRIATTFFIDRQAIAALLASLSTLSLTVEELHSLSMPVCLIFGDHDYLRSSADAMLGQVPDLCCYVIPNANHVNSIWRRALRCHLLRFLHQQANARK